MKRIGKILLAMFMIAVCVFATVTIIRDYKHKNGAFMTNTEYRSFTAKQDAVNAVVIRKAKTAETGQIRGQEGDEQKTVEKETVETICEEESHCEQEDIRVDNKETLQVVEERAEVETDDESPNRDYTVAGVKCPEEIADYLYFELEKHGIADQWYHIALCQMFQESHFDPMAQNPNGKDKGILQYRIDFWDWSRGDIFDWRAQISLYAEQTARRLASGCSIWETVSRHNTSDWGSYNQEYVDQVFQWIAPE